MIIRMKNLKEEDARVYEPSDAPYRVITKKNTCFFCDHLTDIFWDYSNGPYMFVCDIDEEINDGLAGNCVKFEETGEENE